MNIILAGVGGQGTVLASKLIAQAAMHKGYPVRTAETIGMAQRGGCVFSHVRIGDAVYSPLVPKQTADVIIGFEPAEAVRALPYLKPQGTIIVSQKAIKPVTASLGASGYDGSEMLAYLLQHYPKGYVVDGEAICAVCGSSKVLNIALLGAATASGVLGLSLAEMEDAIKAIMPVKLVAMNMKALSEGAATIEKKEEAIR
ncbi:indolepyruvate oxidoreductase subunit beta [Dehalobacter sp. DCM]|uniref:indolepyruvate oxidoreductase subunit beta n=1 Tax=Dehalobacter sp. DCM TaxID=2907827 RepID=UPI003081C548|nr:indolepyruvate oxidoreductase subunit beta [Dehalobacter sp. DCM]